MEATSLPRGRTLTLPRGVLARLDDERLVAALRRGNVGAFEVIYDRHHRGILAYARHLLGSQEEAEDAVQQTFASAHVALIGDERDIKLKAWLYAIARNRCLSVLRARREQPAELDDISTAGLAEEVQHRDDLRALLADLQDLPEPQRAALVLASVSGLGHAEIAQILECDVAKVKSLVFQARSGLIERRQARETPCAEIREQLSVLSGGSLRRGPLRRHLRACPGCAAYREQVKRQRQMLAVALPVIPTLGLKESALAVAFGAGGAAGGGAAAGGLAGAAISAGAKTGLAKMAAVVVAGGAAVGGGTYAVMTDHVPALGGDRPPAERAASAPASGGPPVAPAAPPAFDERRSSESSRERGARRKAARKRLQARRRALRERREQRRRGRDERRGGEGLRGPDRDDRRGRSRRGRDESRDRNDLRGREQDEPRGRGDFRGRDGGREEAERSERSGGRTRSQRRRRTRERSSRERPREPAQPAPERGDVRRGTHQ